MKLRIDKGRLERLVQAAGERPAPRARLLVVDDEEENLFSLVRLLERTYEVRASSDPIEALEMVRQAPVDVVLTDQRMPEMLGTELLAAIKRIDDDNARMILTGYTDAKDLITCINEGLAHRYLVKPWRIAELEAVIAQSLTWIEQQRTLRKLIPHPMLDRLYGGRVAEVRPGEGRQLHGAVLVLELRGFGAATEGLDPGRTFGLLTDYMTQLVPVIGRHHGFIERSVGDGLLAIFDREGLAGADALACARNLVQQTEGYNAERAERGGPTLKIGIGVCCGPLKLGTVGAPGRLEFRAVGEVVQMAQRLQALTQRFQCEILADASAVQRVAIPSRALGDVAVKRGAPPIELHVVYPR